MGRTTFQVDEIDQARRLLGLGERASIEEIKIAYRQMCKRWHPDSLRDNLGSSTKMREINAAYRLLLDYCENYRCSFLPDKVESLDPEKWWYQRFGENIRSPVEEDKDEE
jgi:hypothetical protein